MCECRGAGWESHLVVLLGEIRLLMCYALRQTSIKQAQMGRLVSWYAIILFKRYNVKEYL